MHRTIFDTPVINTLLRLLSLAILKLAGWKVTGSLPPNCEKSVFIAAPHTSNWDFPVTLMVCFVLRLRIYWVGKASLFSWPVGGLMRWLGGIPIDRSKANNLVQTTIDAFARTKRLTVIVPPEGTRGKVTHWKTGFYYIAVGAQVPIVMSYLDYQRKITGIGPVLRPSGDIEADMIAIKAFYAPFKGKNPDQF